MNLTVTPRIGEKKSDVKQIRREGNIPAIIYSRKGRAEKIIVNGDEFHSLLRGLQPGHLPTTVFSLHDGKTVKTAIVKDIQYHLTTYKVSHLDFEELEEGAPVIVRVPVVCTGVVDCVGIKLGGFLRHVQRHVRIACLPHQIPSEFQVDVRDLGIRQAKRIKDIHMPEGVQALEKLEGVVVIIAKR
jgi:large subunit ribosomal protein L25